MSDNKYTAMMGDEERWHTTRSNVYRNVNKELADGCEKKAADWRAMREAWEAMVEAITQLCEDADEHDLLRDYVTVDRVLYENLTAALAKARAT